MKRKKQRKGDNPFKRLRKEYAQLKKSRYFTSLYIAMITAIFQQLLVRMTGRFYEVHRVRKDLQTDIFDQLGDYYFTRAYRMDSCSFYKLHDILEPYLAQQFFPKEGGIETMRLILT
jgi:hypothetical protein